MKKLTLVFTIFLLLLLSACSSSVNNPEEIPSGNVEAPKKNISTSYNQISVFEGALKNTEDFKLEQLDISIEKDVWKINGKEYISYQTVETSIKNFSRWKMDFSKLIPCCKSNDFVIYSNDGKSDNDVLLVEYSNTFFMLVHGDVLNPINYKTEDVIAEIYDSDNNLIANIELEEIWQSHLSNKNNINAVASEEGYSIARFRLKEYPELVYTFPFIKINDDICSPPIFAKNQSGQSSQSGDGSLIDNSNN